MLAESVRTKIDKYDKPRRFLDTIGKNSRRISDSTGPALINKFESHRKALVELVMRNTRIRFVTEITKVNIDDIKELAKISNDVRHLDGCKGNFAINEAEYLSIIVHNDYLVHKQLLINWTFIL